MKTVLTIILATLLFSPARSLAQSLSRSGMDNIHDSIDSLIRYTARTQNIPAIAFGVIQGGDITLQKGYGVTERGTSENVNEYTCFQIASLSKMFTGILANSLILEEKLKIDESIVSYLPEELSDKEKKKLEPITIKDLLLHRSGIQRDSKSYKRKDGEPMEMPYTRSNLIEDLEKAKIKKRELYNYSNVGYAVLGYILERVSGLTYEELLKKYVTDKYQLAKTSAYPFQPQATPYRKDKRDIKTKAWETGMLTPASGIYSNINDLTILMAEQLKVYRKQEAGKLKSPLYLTKEKDFRGDGKSYYGMGLWEFEFDRGILYGHSGDMDGFASQYRFNSTTNTGFVLLTSSGGDWTDQLIAEVSKIIEEYAIKSNDID